MLCIHTFPAETPLTEKQMSKCLDGGLLFVHASLLAGNCIMVLTHLLYWQMTAADLEFIRKHSSGYICVGMEGSTLDRLQLPLMVSSAENDEAMYTAFTVRAPSPHSLAC